MKVNGRQVYLGIWGSEDSHRAYQQVLTDWRAGKPGPVSLREPEAPTVAMVADAFTAAAESGQRPTGPSELKNFRPVTKILKEEFGPRQAATFDADCLDTLRQAMRAKGWCARYASRQCIRVRTVWRWAERKKMVPRGAWEHLRTLQLGGGRTDDEVAPVPEGDLAATLETLRRIPRAMVEMQLHTGARPGEIMGLTPAMVHRAGKFELRRGVPIVLGKIWIADLAFKHKTGWRGTRKILFLGPRAQAVLKPFLDRPADKPCFSPQEAAAEFLESMGRRKRRSRRRAPGLQYSRWSYAGSIERACKRAKVTPWAPNQLRHNAATRLVEEFGEAGWEIARVVLGHRHVSTTRIYAADSIKRATEAMERAG